MPQMLARLAERLASRPPRVVEDTSLTPAAVSVTLTAEAPSILLIRRAEREDDRWSGHMAFPGGRKSAEDADLLATARRETLEEVGVDLAGALLLGTLDDVATQNPALPPLVVRPFVLAIPRPVPLRPNYEVAGAVWVLLQEFRSPGVFRPFEFSARGTRQLLPGYHLEAGLVWGMTEQILTPLLTLIAEDER